MLLAYQFILVGDIATAPFFSKIHKKNDFLTPDLSPLDKSVSKIIKKNLSLYRQKVPKSCLGPFMGIVFEESVSQNNIS